MNATIVDPATARRDAEDAARVRVATFIETRDDWSNWPLVKGGQGSVPSEVKSTAAATGWTLMLMLIGAALVSLAFEYRWITVAFGVLVILVAIVTALVMPAPAGARMHAIIVRAGTIKKSDLPDSDGCFGCRLVARLTEADRAWTNSINAIADQFEAELRELQL